MTPDRDTFFDQWASGQLDIPENELSLKEFERIPPRTDLPDGPGSDLGGEAPPSVLDSFTESELLELAKLGEQVISELPPVPSGYRPRASAPAVRSPRR